MRPKILDAFSGSGGCSEGYRRAGFDPYGIDNDPKPLRHYPFPHVCMDALEALNRLLRGEGLTFSNGETLFLSDIAAIHASPPCQAYVDSNRSRPSKHPRLIEPTRERLQASSKPYVIENVVGAPYLQASLMLCGTMFGLALFRHRFFELSFAPPMSAMSCYHWGQVAKGEIAHVVGMHPHGTRNAKTGRRGKAPVCDVPWETAMGIHWMTKQELIQAIPTCYTEYIGGYLLKAVLQGTA